MSNTHKSRTMKDPRRVGRYTLFRFAPFAPLRARCEPHARFGSHVLSRCRSKTCRRRYAMARPNCAVEVDHKTGRDVDLAKSGFALPSLISLSLKGVPPSLRFGAPSRASGEHRRGRPRRRLGEVGFRPASLWLGVAI